MGEIKYNAKEFLAMLLIYGAYADMDFSAAEKENIKNLVGDHIYTKMVSEYDSMSADELFTAIQDYKGIYFPTYARKQELMFRMKELFKSDGDFSEMEEKLLEVLDKLM